MACPSSPCSVSSIGSNHFTELNDEAHGVSRSTISVRFADLDGYRHVNNSVYCTYFEEARIAYFGSPESVVANKLLYVVGSQEVKYLRPLSYPDSVTCATKISSIDSKSSFIMTYAMFSEAQKCIVALGKSKIVCINAKGGKEELHPKILELAMRDNAENVENFGMIKSSL
eukprot:GHVH01008516.1.p1 GENE.GHVH01008516.1~~GHVH01008516.1.p1  ORF type:complete len:171 (+),score=16.58 GHVH01008516.1:74-586(+)